MNFLLTLLTALVLSMAMIPVMIRLAPRIGMVDMPDPRKVHALPIPRVGGVGIVLGAMISLLLWGPHDHQMWAFLFGSMVLFIFGVWDDSHELGHYVKFIGQFIAVIAVVFWGDVWVAWVPLLDSPLPEAVGKAFTVIALVGMINAINHSDGLDGLAGGESMMSLGAVTFLAFRAEGYAVVVTAAAVMGGIFGFLRYNTHPAKVFMGDAGSQFIGFALGYLVVRLTQEVDSNLSMALPALLLGLPVIDILAVFAQRIYNKMNWFRATKNHIHHRLLELGFDHYQSVVLIYGIQAFFVLSALLLAYQSDYLILGLYLGVSGLIFFLIVTAKKLSWSLRHTDDVDVAKGVIHSVRTHPLITKWPVFIIGVSLPIYFLVNAFRISGLPEITIDFGVVGMITLFMTVISLIKITGWGDNLLRLAVFATASTVVFLLEFFSGSQDGLTNDVFFGLLAVLVAIAVRYDASMEFKTTPTDYLIVVLVLAIGLLTKKLPEGNIVGMIMIKSVVLFYAAEIIINRENRLLSSVLAITVIAVSSVLSLRGLSVI